MLKTQNETEFKVKQGDQVNRFNFRPVDFDRDLKTLYEWMHKSHIAPFWKLNLPMPEFKQWLRNSIEADHKEVFLGTFNGIPACYLIAYDIKADPIQNHYEYKEGDLGMHLLIGPRPFLNKEDGLSIIQAMIIFLYQYFGAKRIIGEPDVRNRIIIPILKELGGEVLGQFDLPHKKASLIIGERDAIMNRLKERNVEVEMIRSITTVEKRRDLIGWR
ncbi:GNAT family N-acetyltransferase [Fictibacillus phosphorivorans]|uniref:GNAT family N-acetyltransferase n=1 Tax=Fictibacillus phosphorivorans TaxID=1221500 RepID=UPI002041428E|nr:GNAT family N-acetyltransferase [Fictibacillus phosphorivorans]MCM3718145.1 acetyltransferase [Fictibacillus phosphorivorans]MCM3775772.1 acetyltransferase [Fictibacillus phosphorivorans]